LSSLMTLGAYRILPFLLTEHCFPFFLNFLPSSPAGSEYTAGTPPQSRFILASSRFVNVEVSRTLRHRFCIVAIVSPIERTHPLRDFDLILPPLSVPSFLELSTESAVILHPSLYSLSPLVAVRRDFLIHLLGRGHSLAPSQMTFFPPHQWCRKRPVSVTPRLH